MQHRESVDAHSRVITKAPDQARAQLQQSRASSPRRSPSASTSLSIASKCKHATARVRPPQPDSAGHHFRRARHHTGRKTSKQRRTKASSETDPDCNWAARHHVSPGSHSIRRPILPRPPDSLDPAELASPCPASSGMARTLDTCCCTLTNTALLSLCLVHPQRPPPTP